MKATRNPGQHIASLRETYSLSRETLAERSSVSVDLIARMEDESYIPDLAPLVKLSRALGVRLGTLLDDHEELGPVVCRGGEASDAVRFISGGTGAPATGLSFKSLAADKAGRHMEPFLIDVLPSSDPVKSTHEGEEFLYVMKGSIKLEYGSDVYQLNEGDSIYYDSIVPHRVAPNGDAGETRILAVVYAPM